MVKKLLNTIAFCCFLLRSLAQVPDEVFEHDDIASFKTIDGPDSFLLHKAAAYEALEIGDYLIQNGVALNQYDHEGNTPLHVAAIHHHAGMVQRLLEAGADVQRKQNSGLKGTALMLAARVPDPELLDLLINHGARVNDGDKNGDPALNWATFYGTTANMKLLLDRGADLSIESKHGNAIDVGLRLWHADSVLEVFRKTSFVNETQGQITAWNAIKSGDTGFRLKNVNMTDALGSPLLQIAAEVGDLRWTQLLLSKGADPNQLNRVGQVPLAFAARFGHTAVVKALLEAGANPGLAGAEYYLTPMIGAAISGNVEIARQLISAGASLDEVDVINGAAPLHWAIMYQNHDFASFLLSKGADSQRKIMADRFTALSLAEALDDSKMIDIIRRHKAEEMGILGSWRLDSIDYITPDTLVSIKPGSGGALIVVPERYSIMYAQTSKSRVPFERLSQPTEAEIIAGFRSIVFNSGSYVLEGGDFITTADIAKVPGFEGGIQYYRFGIFEDKLTLQLYDETYPDGGKPEWLGRVEVKMTFRKE